MIKWFKKYWNEPLTVKTCVQLSGWMLLISFALAWPMTILMFKSIVIMDKIGCWMAQIQYKVIRLIEKIKKSNEEDDYED